MPCFTLSQSSQRTSPSSRVIDLTIILNFVVVASHFRVSNADRMFFRTLAQIILLPQLSKFWHVLRLQKWPAWNTASLSPLKKPTWSLVQPMTQSPKDYTEVGFIHAALAAARATILFDLLHQSIHMNAFPDTTLMLCRE